jgi:succinoglycan biosynthesis protein ExoL
MPPTILVVLQTIGDARDSKRISMLQAAGYSVTAAAFDRGSHTARPPTCPVKILGAIQDGRYFRRLLKMAQVILRLRAAIRDASVVYALGPDVALLSVIAGQGLSKPLVLEVADIREIQVRRSVLGRVVRHLDRWVARSCSLLVATAQGFITEYYEKRLGACLPSLLLQNKLDHPLPHRLPTRGPRTSFSPLRIGYFGVLRCDWSWRVLKLAATKSNGMIEIVVAGVPTSPRIKSEIHSFHPGVTYLGAYRSPEDLPGLYEKVDLTWAVYPPPTGDPEWEWAQAICRSNRFYESCYFGCPIIALQKSADADEVKRLNIGMVLPASDDEEIASFLRTMTNEEINHWISNIQALPEEVYVNTDEAERLATELKKLLALVPQ